MCWKYNHHSRNNNQHKGDDICDPSQEEGTLLFVLSNFDFLASNFETWNDSSHDPQVALFNWRSIWYLDTKSRNALHSGSCFGMRMCMSSSGGKRLDPSFSLFLHRKTGVGHLRRSSPCNLSKRHSSGLFLTPNLHVVALVTNNIAEIPFEVFAVSLGPFVCLRKSIVCFDKKVLAHTSRRCAGITRLLFSIRHLCSILCIIWWGSKNKQQYRHISKKRLDCVFQF